MREAQGFRGRGRQAKYRVANPVFDIGLIRKLSFAFCVDAWSESVLFQSSGWAGAGRLLQLGEVEKI